MLLTETVKVKWNPKIKRHYENKGYIYTKMGDEFEVKFHDLTNGSHCIIEYKCDYCGQIKETVYKLYIRNHKTVVKDSCSNCAYKKTTEVMKAKYGVSNAFLFESSKQKSKDAILLDQEFVKKEFNKRGYEILDRYKNNRTKISFRCSKHLDQIQQITYNSFQRGSGCKICGREKIKISKIKHSLEQVAHDFTKMGFTLLEEKYESIERPMKCICNHHPNIIQMKTYDSIYLRHGCKYCAIEKRTGKGHPRWNPNLTDEERAIGRRYKEYIEWRIAVFMRDKHRCQCCGEKKSGKINAHHIYNYSNNKYLRTTLENGITLCEDCHIGFHAKYGRMNNNLEQLLEHINEVRKDIDPKLIKKVKLNRLYNMEQIQMSLF
jgi:hypothetical protein